MRSIPEEDRLSALATARRALVDYLERGLIAGETGHAGPLRQRRAAFVTLRRRETGELRGCRGECRATRPLIASIVRHTVLAATDDSRFRSVSPDEVSELTIRINALTAPRPIRTDEIILGRHGLVLVQGRRSGLLLPEVPAHFGWQTPDEFLDALFRKARLDRAEPWEEDLELYAFETEVWGEDDES